MIKLIKLFLYNALIKVLQFLDNIVYNLLVRHFSKPKYLNKAIAKADKLHKETGKRYRVFFLKMRYRVFCREDIKDGKKSGFFLRHTNSTRLDGYKYYDTLDRKISI